MATRPASPTPACRWSTDSVPDFAGPLAGVLAGLDWAAANAPEVADLVSVPGDCPFLPADLVTQTIGSA